MAYLRDLTGAKPGTSGITRQVASATIQSTSDMDRRVKKILEYIASSPIDATLDSAAAAVLISPSRLRHLFKEQVGLSFHKYLINVRLERARHLLSTTD